MTPLGSLLAAFALWVFAGGAAHAADCDGRQAAGYRVLTLANGRKVAVWYPAAAEEKPFAYARTYNGFMGSVAFDAPPAACPRVPLVLFSHGLGGCGLQTLFLTEELARHGYVVAAPDHADSATCGIGAVGHSLGGYTVIGMAGGWPSWKSPEIKAVLALSPYVAPFVVHGTIGKLSAPVMYQGAEFDWGITQSLEGPKGAYALSAAPKFFVKLKGGTHFEWTNLICVGQTNVVDCLTANRNAYLIDRYGIEFLDRYLKDKPSPALAFGGRGLDKYEFAVQ